MKKGCIRVAGCGCLSCIAIIWLLFIFILVYTYSGAENLYYIEDDNMYVSFKKNLGDDVCVYFGKTTEDVDNKLDGYKVHVVMLDDHYVHFTKDRTKDSIFLIDDVETTTILSSTHYVFVPLPSLIEDVTCRDLSDYDRARLKHRYDDTRFRNNPSNYEEFSYNKDVFWHKKNTLMINRSGHYKFDQSKVKYIDPIER